MLVKFLPYGYVILSSVFLHTVGYVLYAITNTSWLLILSRILSGLYIGVEPSCSLTYIIESSAIYQQATQELGEDNLKANHVKYRLIALHYFGYCFGAILGPGMPLIFCKYVIIYFL